MRNTIPLRFSATLNLTGTDGVPRFACVAYDGGPTCPKQFEHPVYIDLATARAPRQDVPLIVDHDPGRIVGQTDAITVSGASIEATGGMTGAGLNADADTIIARSKQGHTHQVSVGGNCEYEFIEPGRMVPLNDGQTATGPAYIAHDFTLREISVVTIGAAENTSLHIQPNPENTMNNTTPPTVAPTEDLAATYEQARMVERRRIAAIMKIGSGQYPDLERDAIQLGWPVEQFHAEYSHRAMPSAARIPVTGTQQRSAPEANMQQVIEASFLQSAGMDGDRLLKLGYDERTLDMATDRRFRGETLQTLLRKAANDGGNVFSDGTIRAAYDNLRYGSIHASFSSVSIPGILSNAANKMLLNGYAAIDDPTPLLSKDIHTNDFKEVSLYQLVITGEMEEVAPTGEIKHASLGETPYKAKAETRGAVLGISRETIINDDMGALGDLFIQFGRKVVLTKQKLWFKKFLENRDKIKSVPGNPALSVESLQTMKTAFDSLTDAAGDLILANGQYLLTPPSLWATASTLLKTLIVDSQRVVSLGTSPVFDALELLKSPHLGGTSPLAGSSDTGYYMFTNPLAVAAMGTVYLKGNRNPVIETFDCDVQTLGMATRCFFDYGVAFLDPNGVLRSEGTDE